MKRISSVDVAKLAGVSQSTVSRVFSPNANVAAGTKARVLDAANELGYKPNVLARSLITQSSNLIGVVVADVASSFYANFLSALSHELRAIGKQVILFNVGLETTADEVLPTLLEYQVDALIIADTTLSSDMAVECAQHGTPVILFNRSVELSQVSSIGIDHRDGGRKVAELFLQSGHQQFGYIAGIESTQSNQLREAGYRQRLAESGVVEVQRAVGDYSYQSGYDAALTLLQQPIRPDALFCANDQMAFGAIDAARSLGLPLPESLSIAGFDNVPQAGWDAYQLTTVAQPMESLLATTMDVLAERLANGASFVPQIDLLPGELIVRKSVRLSEA